MVSLCRTIGPRIHALVIYYKSFQALSYERLLGMFRDAFGLSVSEGALMNMFIRSHAKFEVEADKAKAILRAPPQATPTRFACRSDLAHKLQAKIGRAKDQLLTFCDYPSEVDVTNNTSERKLRPCVIQRKVTNGHRVMWAAEAKAHVRTTIDTARLTGADPFAVIIATLA